jgi:hypothetical protein
MISLSYPIFAASETINDARRFLTGTDSLDRDAIVGIAIGLISAIVSLLLFSLLRTVLLGDRSAGSGLFFGEGIAYWIVRKFKKVTRTRSPLFFGFPLHVPGFTDPQTRRLLPGHLQLLIALVASVSVYVFWYYRTTNSATIGFDDWPVGSYLLLVIYCGGAIMSLIAFILDRYRIPIFVVTIAYLSLVSDSHRYFELVPTSDEFRLGELPEGSSSLLMKALATRPADAKDYAEPPYLEELYGKSFQLPVWKDGKRTLVVVTASGGGIQAAGWTARVLTGLEKHSPKLAESIGLISSPLGVENSIV